jgi:hypothetical protein
MDGVCARRNRRARGELRGPRETFPVAYVRLGRATAVDEIAPRARISSGDQAAARVGGSSRWSRFGRGRCRGRRRGCGCGSAHRRWRRGSARRGGRRDGGCGRGCRCRRWLRCRFCRRGSVRRRSVSVMVSRGAGIGGVVWRGLSGDRGRVRMNRLIQARRHIFGDDRRSGPVVRFAGGGHGTRDRVPCRVQRHRLARCEMSVPCIAGHRDEDDAQRK